MVQGANHGNHCPSRIIPYLFKVLLLMNRISKRKCYRDKLKIYDVLNEQAIPNLIVEFKIVH